MTTQKIDTALVCLVTIAKIHGIPAEIEQLRRAYVVSPEGLDKLNLLRAAKDLGLKVRLAKPNVEKLTILPYPAIAVLSNGTYAVVAKADGDKFVIIDPHHPQPIAVLRESFLKVWSGEMIFVTRRYQILLRNVVTKFGLSWFTPIIWRYKKYIFQVLGLSLIIQLLGLASPLFTQVIIDKVLVHRSLTTLDILVIGMLAVTVFQLLLLILRSYLFMHTTNRMDVTLSSRLFKHITSLPLRFFENWQAGDIVARVREIDVIRQFLTGTALSAILDTVFALVYVAMMFYYSSMLSVIALLVIPVFLVLTLTITPIFRRRLNESFAARTENQAFLIESLTGIQTVKSLALEPRFNQKWEQVLAKNVNTTFATANLANFAGGVGGFVQQGFNVAILWVGTYSVIQGNLSVGQLVAFQMMAAQVIGPIMRLLNIWQNFQQSMVSINRLADIMDEPAEPSFNPNRTTLPAINGEVVLDRVTFRYRTDGQEILKQISLRIPAGSRVGIVGRSGSGKSTLTKLLQRLYVPDNGRVLIDGVDLAQVEPAWLRRQIGVVLQENYLFNGSIQENIAIAQVGVQMEDVERAATIAGAHEFISKMPDGYNTVVGERGASLSGGQRQRIAIARALITDPKILIFDEATSALDYESEKIVMDNLDQIASGRTMILIAHRLSTVRNCDVIVVMDHGRIIELGNHTDLMAKKGYYYQMNMHQEQM